MIYKQLKPEQGEKKLLKATFGSNKTPLVLGDVSIECYVLEDGTAVLSGRGNQRILGFSNTDAGDRLTRMIKSNKFVKYASEDLVNSINNPIVFIRTTSSGSQPITNGYEATILIDICYVFIDAKNRGEILTPFELAIEMQAEFIVRAFSKVGIVATIYKLTGYLDGQVSTFLNDILNKYLLEEAKKYVITYPLELYKQWYRLNDWEWTIESKQKRPSVIGTWTNDLIYSRLKPDLLKELKKRNPKNEKGIRKYKHFQFLTDEIGEPKLREFFGGLIALAKAAPDWRRYYAMVNRAYPKINHTLDIPYIIED
jgi:hypothetical protein